MKNLYVIECRTPDGRLDFNRPSPEDVFGMKATTGIDSDTMAKTIFRKKKDAVLDGRYVESWPTLLDPRWAARKKTW